MTGLGLEPLLELEHDGWRSLCRRTGAEFYEDLMLDDGLMLLAGGLCLGRDDVVETLRDAEPWAGYQLSEPHAVPLGPGATTLVYTAEARRAEGPELRAHMASTYVWAGGRVRLALHQQTPLL
ncbi:MAG: DUF4440 domain-containing protein [Frankiales bacterium]|nr:DUF4440 domain-containing protein [Frankiales bacterium]